MLRKFRSESPIEGAARRLYESLVERSRVADFYRSYGVADTIDGRFDLLALHAFVMMQALKQEGEAGAELGTALATTIFTGFDDALRELGVGDFGLSQRIKAMANAFYGRLEAYEAAVGAETTLASAILRNLYRGEPAQGDHAVLMARYIMAARARLAAPESARALLSGVIDFGPVPSS